MATKHTTVIHTCQYGKCVFKEYCYPYQCLLNNPLIENKEEVKGIIENAKDKSADAKFRLLNKYFKERHPPKVTGSQIKKHRKKKILEKYGMKETKQVARIKVKRKRVSKWEKAKIQERISTSPVYTFKEFLEKINNEVVPNFHY